MKAPPRTPSNSPPGPTTSSSCTSHQAIGTVGSYGFSATSRVAGGDQLPRTGANQTTRITHNAVQSILRPLLPATSNASTRSSVPAASFGPPGTRVCITDSCASSSLRSAAAATLSSGFSACVHSSASAARGLGSSILSSTASGDASSSRLTLFASASRHLASYSPSCSRPSRSTLSKAPSCLPALPAFSVEAPPSRGSQSSLSSPPVAALSSCYRTAVTGSVLPSAAPQAQELSPDASTCSSVARHGKSAIGLPLVAINATGSSFSPAVGATSPPSCGSSSPTTPASLRVTGAADAVACSSPLHSGSTFRLFRTTVTTAAAAPPRTSFSPAAGTCSAYVTVAAAPLSPRAALFRTDNALGAFPLPAFASDSSFSPPTSSSSSSRSTPASTTCFVADTGRSTQTNAQVSQSSVSRDTGSLTVTQRSCQHADAEEEPPRVSSERLPSAVREARKYPEENVTDSARHPPQVSEESSAMTIHRNRGLQAQLSAGPGALIVKHRESDVQYEPVSVEVMKLMAKARLAASLENWNDVVATMKRVAAAQPSFNASQRILLAGAYTHQLTEKRTSIRHLQARIKALQVLQQQLPEESGASEGKKVSRASVTGGQEIGGAGSLKDTAAGTAVWKRATGGEKDDFIASIHMEGMDSDEDGKTSTERLAANQAKASAFLGEVYMDSEDFVPYAGFFAYMMMNYCQRVADSMIVLLNDMETFLTSVLLPAAECETASAAYEQLRADSFRHVAQEFRDLKNYTHCLEPAVLQRNDQRRQMLEKKSKLAYEAALKFAEEATPTKVSSVRLGIMNNYAVLLQEMDDGRDAERAVDMLGSEFQQTVRQMYEVKDEEEYQRIISVLGLIRDNVEAWCRLVGSPLNLAT